MEMIHETRIIPLDGRAYLPPAVRQWLGDLRGRWEGPERFTRVDAVRARKEIKVPSWPPMHPDWRRCSSLT